MESQDFRMRKKSRYLVHMPGSRSYNKAKKAKKTYAYTGLFEAPIHTSPTCSKFSARHHGGVLLSSLLRKQKWEDPKF